MTFRVFLMMFAVLLVSACSSTDDPSADDMASGSDPMMGQSMDTRGVEGQNMGGPDAGTQADLVTTVGDRVFYGYDQHNLDSEARATVERQAEWLKQYPNVNVMIEGHADERGTREYNLALGERRANSVQNYLLGLGVSSSRMRTISYGSERPAVPGSNPEAWAQNRRAVLVVE